MTAILQFGGRTGIASRVDLAAPSSAEIGRELHEGVKCKAVIELDQGVVNLYHQHLACITTLTNGQWVEKSYQLDNVTQYECLCW